MSSLKLNFSLPFSSYANASGYVYFVTALKKE